MVLVWERLDDALHEVLLGQRIFANHNDFKDLWQDSCLVDFEGESFQAAQPDDVLTNSHSQFVSLNFSHILVLLRAQMLEAHPESIHLAHVLQNEVNGICHIAILWAFKLRAHIRELVLHHFEQVVSQEEASDGLLHSLDHVEEVSQYQLDWRFFGLDVGRANCDQQIESRDDVAGVLHRLVQVAHLSSSLLLLDEMVLQVCQFVECHHIELEVVPGAQE